MRNLISQRKILVKWDMQPSYIKLCKAIEKTPALPGLKDRYKLWCLLPGRLKEPFLVVSTLSISTHAKGPWSTPLYASLVLRESHQDARVAPLIRELSVDSVLPSYESSALRRLDTYQFDSEELTGLAQPDPEEVERLHQIAVKGGT